MATSNSDHPGLSDAELVRELERCRLAPADFPHAAHLRVAHYYLSNDDWLEAARGMSRTLRRFAASAGKQNLYHETITLAFLQVIGERMALDARAGEDSAVFFARHPDLSDRKLLLRYYRPERLMSPLARAQFIAPEPAAIPYQEI